SDHVPIVEHEHLVGNLIGLHAVGVVEKVDLGRDHLRIAHAVAVGSERRIDAAERAFIWAAKRRIDRGVGSARGEVAETLPIMRPVLLHWQQVPGVAVQVLVEVIDEGGRGGAADLAVVPPDQALDAPVVVRDTRPKNLEEFRDRDRSLPVAGEVNGLFAEGLLGQGGDVPADHDYWQLRILVLNGPAGWAGGNHLLARRGRLMAENNHAYEPP